MSLQSSTPPALPGLEFVLNSKAARPSGQLQEDDIADDMAGEQETIPDLAAEDFVPPDENEGDIISGHGQAAAWTKTVAGASKGVSDKTDSDYRRCVCILVISVESFLMSFISSLIEHCASFLISNHFIAKRDEFFCTTPPENSPTLISAWIMSE